MLPDPPYNTVLYVHRQLHATHAAPTPTLYVYAPHPPLLQSLELPLKRGGIKNNEYFYRK